MTYKRKTQLRTFLDSKTLHISYFRFLSIVMLLKNNENETKKKIDKKDLNRFTNESNEFLRLHSCIKLNKTARIRARP